MEDYIFCKTISSFDARDCADIEGRSSEVPLSEKQILDMISKDSVNGVIAEVNGSLVGYCLYTIKKNSLEIHSFVVDVACRRHGIGRCMMTELKKRLRPNKLKLVVHIPDHCLIAHQFLRSQGFIVTEIMKNASVIHGNDAYKFEFFGGSE